MELLLLVLQPDLRPQVIRNQVHVQQIIVPRQKHPGPLRQHWRQPALERLGTLVPLLPRRREQNALVPAEPAHDVPGGSDLSCRKQIHNQLCCSGRRPVGEITRDGVMGQETDGICENKSCDNGFGRGCWASSAHCGTEHRPKTVPHKSGLGIIMDLEYPFNGEVRLVRGHAVALQEVIGDIGNLDHDDGTRNGGQCHDPVDVLDQADTNAVNKDQRDLVVGIDGAPIPVS